MFCTQCGTKLASTARFCSNCGLPISVELLPVGATVTKTTSTAQANVTDPAKLGTKWLKFWNYFSLPVGGIFGLLIPLGMPNLGIIMVPFAILQFAVAYGLHQRKLWAWRWNWVLIVLTWFSGAIPNSFGSSADLLAKFAILVPVFGLVWMWPNYLYWRKRRFLFSIGPTPDTWQSGPLNRTQGNGVVSWITTALVAFWMIALVGILGWAILVK